MSTEVKILTDTMSPAGKRITTFLLKYPRYIHPEILTHRSFSKNCSSSRAIPMHKIIQQVIKDPVIPIHFGANKVGMSAKEELRGWRRMMAKRLWLWSRWPAVFFAILMNKLGLHKQIGNRILEPWMYISVLLTGTEFDNFYSLRCDKENAHPDIYGLAEKMLAAQNESTPIISLYHLPFITWIERGQAYCVEELLKISVARCCRISYLNHDNTKTSKEKCIELYDRLLRDGHLSPFEHQAFAYNDPKIRSANFVGWQQYRKTIPNEERTNFERLTKKWTLK